MTCKLGERICYKYKTNIAKHIIFIKNVSYSDDINNLPTKTPQLKKMILVKILWNYNFVIQER